MSPSLGQVQETEIPDPNRCCGIGYVDPGIFQHPWPDPLPPEVVGLFNAYTKIEFKSEFLSPNFELEDHHDVLAVLMTAYFNNGVVATEEIPEHLIPAILAQDDLCVICGHFIEFSWLKQR